MLHCRTAGPFASSACCRFITSPALVAVFPVSGLLPQRSDMLGHFTNFRISVHLLDCRALMLTPRGILPMPIAQSVGSTPPKPSLKSGLAQSRFPSDTNYITDILLQKSTLLIFSPSQNFSALVCNGDSRMPQNSAYQGVTEMLRKSISAHYKLQNFIFWSSN